MLSLVYTSTATAPFDDADLATLLMNSRANNRRLGLTGFLLHRDGRFIQALEGPDDVVRDRLRIIEADPRHSDIAILVEDQESDRQVPAWSMGYETVNDDLADQIPGYRSAFDDIAENSPALENQPTIRQLLSWFQQRASQAA
jgi:hypothetical protein